MDYTNTLIRELIADYIHNAIDRRMLAMRLIDGMTFEAIGFELGMTTKTVRLRIHRGEEILFKHIPG